MLEGQVLEGRYRVGGQIGSGSFGHVYEGHHTSLAQRVAIKVFRSDVVMTAGGPDRVLGAAKAASRVHHRSIVDVHDLGKVDDTVYVVAELVLGRTLHEHLVRGGRMPWPRARAVALQIVAALKAAHKRNVLHRGLRAANCFVLDDPTKASDEVWVKVSDFGFAHPGLAGGSRGEEHTSPFVGDAAYTAPELSRGGAPTVHSDIYAFGVILHRMVTGALPFEGGSPFQVLAAHVEQPVPSIRARVPSLPEELEAVVVRALAKDPADRFESARELEVALEEIEASAAIEPETGEGEAGDSPGAALDDAATGPHRKIEEPSPPVARDESMHAAFEHREDDVVPTSMFDRQLLVPYFGPAADDRELPPEPTVMLGASFFGQHAPPAHAQPPPEPTVMLSGQQSGGSFAAPPAAPSAEEMEEPTALFRVGEMPGATMAASPFAARVPPTPHAVPSRRPVAMSSPVAPHTIASAPARTVAPMHSPGSGAAAMTMRPPGTGTISFTNVLLIGAAVAFGGALVGLAMACPSRGAVSLHQAGPASHAQRRT